MTIARAEMSNNVQNPASEVTAPKGVSIALIGPNDAHRKTVARGLASAPGRKVHEIIDYPGNLNDLPQMAEQNFDVVLVDVDTDQSYALQIIERLASLGVSVMAYSARTDQDLLMNCMRAGACDFVPLPTENQAEAETAPPAQAPVQQELPKPQPSKPAPPAARTITPIVPERRAEPVAEVRPVAIAEEHIATPAAELRESLAAADAATVTDTAEAVPSDFAAWDAVNLRPAPVVPPVPKKAEPRPRPSLVPERKKSEPVQVVAPAPEEKAAPAPVERPPVTVDIFRSDTFRSESEPSEAAEKQGANWVKWILIAAGPLVLALVLLVVFTRQSASSAAPTTVKDVHPPASAASKILPGSQLIVNATGKPGTQTTTPSKPAPGIDASVPAAETPAPVSPDAMAAQLVAPSRIAGSIKKGSASDEAPPAPAPVAFDDNGAIPGAVFSNSAKAKVADHVVPISAGVADGMILRKTPPVYPKFAQEAHISGRVVLKATITKQGTIEGVQVVSGPKILAPSAVDAVKTWKYRPYMLDNQPVSVETSITIVFGTNK